MRLAVNGWFWNRLTAGSGQYVRRLVEHLCRAEPKLELALVTPGERVCKPAGLQTGRAQAPNLRFLPTADRRWMPVDLYKVWFEQVAFPRACRRIGADVAHVPYWAPPLRPAIPTVVTIHDLIPLLLPEYRGGLLVRLYTALVSASARSAALVLTDSEASRRDIIAHLGLPAGRVRTAYLAVGKRYTSTPAPDDAQARARHSLPERYVLYLGGFDVRKNLATAIEAYSRAEPTIGETCSLAVAGRLPEQDTLFTPDPRQLARERGLNELHVRFTGSVAEEDKPALYRGALAFVFPSRYEGFGLPPLEALACGTPVVGSDTSSIPEVVGDGGVLLGPDDAAGMAEALVRLVTDAGFRAELSRRALAQAARFSWERTARETLAAYRDVARARQADK